MLKDALQTLSEKSPVERKQLLAEANAKIHHLEAQLGIRPKLMPFFNPARAAARIEELEKQLADKPAPAAEPAKAPAAAVARPLELTGDTFTDKAIKESGCHNLATMKAKKRRDDLFATAASLPPGSLARQCAEQNLAAANAEFKNLS